MILLRAATFCLLVRSSSSFDIIAYDVRIVANESEWYQVSETITRDFKEPRHGISRFLPTGKTEYGKTIDVPGHPSVVVPRTRDGVSGLEVRIGNPEQLVSGPQEYKINYEMFISDNPTHAANVIGTEWELSIGNVTFSMVYPKLWQIYQVRVFSGFRGSQENSAGCTYENSNHQITGMCPSLDPGQGVTISLSPSVDPEQGATINSPPSLDPEQGATISFSPTDVLGDFHTESGLRPETWWETFTEKTPWVQDPLLMLCTIIVIGIPGIWLAFRYIPSDAIPDHNLSQSEIACLLNRDFSLRDAILNLANFGFITKEDDQLILHTDAVIDLPLDRKIADDLTQLGPAISMPLLHEHLAKHQNQFAHKVWSTMAAKGLVRGWYRLLIWYPVLAAFSCLWSVFSLVHCGPLSVWVIMIAFWALSTNYIAQILEGLHFIVAAMVYCFIAACAKEPSGSRTPEWIDILYPAIAVTILTFYAWSDSYWTPMGAGLAGKLIREETRLGQRYGYGELPDELKDWNRDYDRRYPPEPRKYRHLLHLFSGSAGWGTHDDSHSSSDSDHMSYDYGSTYDGGSSCSSYDSGGGGGCGSGGGGGGGSDW
jgi:uncharacterized membrane protein YgcG